MLSGRHIENSSYINLGFLEFFQNKQKMGMKLGGCTLKSCCFFVLFFPVYLVLTKLVYGKQIDLLRWMGNGTKSSTVS